MRHRGPVHLTEGGRLIARAIRRGGRRRGLSDAVAVLAALGTLAGVLVAVLSCAPGSDVAAPRPAQCGLAAVRPSTGNAPVITAVPLTLGAGARLLPGSSVPAV